MRYSRLGDSGLIVSALGLGALTFTRDGLRASIPSAVGGEAVDWIIGEAIDAGVNHFNTANVYGRGVSEEILGAALRSRRQDVIISTKVGGRMSKNFLQGGLSRRHILSAAEDSLRRLGVDHIDIYLAHQVDSLTPIEETLSAFDALVSQGKVRYVGFSNWPAWLASKAVTMQRLSGAAPFRAAEIYYSLVGRDVEEEIAPLAADAGIGLIAYSPLAGGYLSGKYPDDEAVATGGRLSSMAGLPIDRRAARAIIAEVRAVAEAHEVAPAAVALAWVMSRSSVASVLMGATSVDQLRANLAAAALILTEDELRRLDAVSTRPMAYPRWAIELYSDRAASRAVGGGQPWLKRGFRRGFERNAATPSAESGW